MTRAAEPPGEVQLRPSGRPLSPEERAESLLDLVLVPGTGRFVLRHFRRRPVWGEHGRKLHPEDKSLTDLKEVDPSAFTYVLINAVKELSAENKQMKAVLCEEHPTASFCKNKK